MRISKPTKIIVDGVHEYADIQAVVATFDTHRETLEPYETVKIFDSSGGIMEFPIERVEWITE